MPDLRLPQLDPDRRVQSRQVCYLHSVRESGFGGVCRLQLVAEGQHARLECRIS